MTRSQPRTRVALLAAPQTSASILYGLYDVLLSVGAVYPDMTVGTPGEATLDVFIVAASAEPFRCFGNILVEPAAAVDDVDDVDVVVISDMYAPITEAPKGKYPDRDRLAPTRPRAGGPDRDGVHGLRAPRRVRPPGRSLVCQPLGVRDDVPRGIPAA